MYHKYDQNNMYQKKMIVNDMLVFYLQYQIFDVKIMKLQQIKTIIY